MKGESFASSGVVIKDNAPVFVAVKYITGILWPEVTNNILQHHSAIKLVEGIFGINHEEAVVGFNNGLGIPVLASSMNSSFNAGR